MFIVFAAKFALIALVVQRQFSTAGSNILISQISDPIQLMGDFGKPINYSQSTTCTNHIWSDTNQNTMSTIVINQRSARVSKANSNFFRCWSSTEYGIINDYIVCIAIKIIIELSATIFALNWFNGCSFEGMSI